MRVKAWLPGLLGNISSLPPHSFCENHPSIALHLIKEFGTPSRNHGWRPQLEEVMAPSAHVKSAAGVGTGEQGIRGEEEDGRHAQGTRRRATNSGTTADARSCWREEARRPGRLDVQRTGQRTGGYDGGDGGLLAGQKAAGWTCQAGPERGAIEKRAARWTHRAAKRQQRQRHSFEGQERSDVGHQAARASSL